MRKRLVAGALVAAGLALAARSTPDAPKVACVDMWRLMREAKQSRREQDLIKEWQDANQKLLDEKQKQLKEHDAERDPLKPQSDEWLEKTKQLKIEKLTFDADLEALDEQFSRRGTKALRDAFTRATAACSMYLEQHDLDAIVQYTSAPVGGRKVDEALNDVATRTLVAYKKTLDVTDQVLAILDK